MDLPTPVKTNMEPENDGSLEGISPLPAPNFQLNHMSFRGCTVNYPTGMTTENTEKVAAVPRRNMNGRPTTLH